MLGTSDSGSRGESGPRGSETFIIYEDYPGLPDLLLGLLDKEVGISSAPNRRLQIGAVEAIYPALELLRRAGQPQRNAEKIVKQLWARVGGKRWLERELAARVLSTILLDDWIVTVTELLKAPSLSTNHRQGVLLTVRFIIKRRLDLNLPTAIGTWSARFAIVMQLTDYR